MTEPLLQIRFVYESFIGVHQELELADIAADVPALREAFRATARRQIDVHGSVSMTLHGVEQLSREYWVEDVGHLALGVGLERLRGFELETRPRTDRDLVDITLRHHERTVGSWSTSQRAWETEWQLCRARAERLRDALGDPAGATWLADWRHGWPEGAHVLVDPAIRRWACEVPLPELLRRRVPDDAP